MDNEKTEYEKLWDEWLPQLKNYAETRSNLIRVTLVENIAKAASTVTSNLILFITFFAFFMFASFALALYIGKLLGDYYLGFLVIAAFYLILFLLALLFRKSIIEKPVMDQTIKNLMEDYDGE